MKLGTALLCALAALLAAGRNGWAQDKPLNSELAAIFAVIATSVEPGQHEQLMGAVKSSALLTDQMNKLAASRKLTDLKLFAKDTLPAGRRKPFQAFVDGTTLFISTDLLKALLNNRLYDVVYDDDVRPNNTAFVLAHLCHHLETSEELDRLLKAPPAGGPSNTLNAFVSARLEDEALAFIRGWNSMLEAAQRANGGRTLTPRQVAQLLMNTRYRFAFLIALRQAPEPIQFSDSGFIDGGNRNIAAIVGALKSSKMADIE